MLKLLVALFGLLEALYPDRVISILTKLSYEYEGEPPVAKPWVVTAARIEGLVLLGVAIRAAIKADWSADDNVEPAAEANDADELQTVDRI